MSGYIALPTMWTFDSWATVDGGRPTVRFHLKSDGSPGTELRTGPATDCQNCQNRPPAIVSPRRAERTDRDADASRGVRSRHSPQPRPPSADDPDAEDSY